MKMANTINHSDITGEAYAIFTDSKGAAATLGINAQSFADRLITQNFKNPARSAAIVIDGAAWAALDSVPEQYRALLATVLTNAAKGILKRYVAGFSLIPAAIPASLFTTDALMDEASGANSEWLNKEELVAAWEASATRKAMVSNPNYAASAPYRKAYEVFKDAVCKLSGKTVSITPAMMNLIVAKLHADDIESDMGLFIVRRIEQLKNKRVEDEASMCADQL